MRNSTNVERDTSQSRLLATVSTLALIVVSMCGTEQASAGEPSLWLELGWNFENVRDSASNIALPLGPLVLPSGLTAPLIENPNLDRNYTDEGKITFRPEGSDWVLSASIRYGRAQGNSQIRQALSPIPTTSLMTYYKNYPRRGYYLHRNAAVPVSAEKLREDTSNAESHLIIDFEAGKDVGLGLFGHGSASMLSAGVRFAHFTVSRKASNFQETQGIHFQASHYYHNSPPYYYLINRRALWNTISADGSSSQKFNGLGPSIQWNASAQLSGNPQDGGISLDWGANAALLFGKQVKMIHHQSTDTGHCLGPGCPANPPVYTSGKAHSSKSITVPNVGGFAGISLKYLNAKISLGYRADLFVNAIDVGIATRKSSNMLLHGPFASVSLGVGD